MEMFLEVSLNISTSFFIAISTLAFQDTAPLSRIRPHNVPDFWPMHTTENVNSLVFGGRYVCPLLSSTF